MLTNNYNLPQPLVDAIVNDKYSRGDSDITVTTLIQPPQIRQLLQLHEPVADASDRIWSLLGQATHTILERAYENQPGIRAEERLYMEVHGWKVGGQFDVYDGNTRTLYDYKITSVWARDGKVEWEQQLNMLRLLAERNDMPVEHLKICAIFRDWSKHKAKYEKDYPQAQAMLIDVPVWKLITAMDFMEERVALHQATARPCTDPERWKTDDVYAVMKTGRKSAVKLFTEAPSAHTFAQDRGKDHSVVFRPGEYKRCDDYCPVSSNCPQWQAHINALPF
jgi:hypothetical protein